MRRLLWPLLVVTLVACDDSGSQVDPEEPWAVVDGAVDSSEPAAGDAHVEVGPQGPDISEPEPEPEPTGPLARVYRRDPFTDAGELTELSLAAPPTAPDGTLKGDYVNVINCLNEEGGQSMLGFGRFCLESNVAALGASGDYTHIEPPSSTKDPNDAFAEVMMFHHVNVIHHYYKGEHGLTDLDYPLDALVNVMLYVDPTAAPFVGLPPGWLPFPNAAFVPPEGFAGFGLPERPGGAIVFGQYQYTDFAYDASVIYHEYTHAMVGTTRLSTQLVDSWGLDNLPGAMNEGFADYFAASVAGHSYIGTYGLVTAGPHQIRNLAEPRVCPDDLTSEVHADGKIIGSAMWALRVELGQKVTDGIILRALESFAMTTNLDQAANLIIDEALLVSEEVGATTEAVLDAHGLRDCQRALPWQAYDIMTDEDHTPFVVGGTSSMPTASFPHGAPAYIQLYVDVPANAAAVSLSWQAEVSQGGLAGGVVGGGDEAPPFKVAIRTGEPVTFEWLAGGAVKADAILASKPTVDGWRGVTLTGNCITAGTRLYTSLLNPGLYSANVLQMDVNVVTSLGGSTVAESCD